MNETRSKEPDRLAAPANKGNNNPSARPPEDS